jgi:hypothetical protein
MARRRRASRTRAPKPAVSAFDLADAMETPLARAQDLVRALEYIGHGLHSLGEDSVPAVFGIAQAMAENLQAVKRLREKLFSAAA